MYEIASRADSRMSSNSPESSEFKGHRAGKDRFAAEAISASLDAGPFAKVDRPAKNLRQLVLHVDEAEQCPRRVLFERHHHIDIALGPEVIAHHTAEKGELRNLPLAAELAEFLLVVVDRDWHDVVSLRRGAVALLVLFAAA